MLNYAHYLCHLLHKVWLADGVHCSRKLRNYTSDDYGGVELATVVSYTCLHSI